MHIFRQRAVKNSHHPNRDVESQLHKAVQPGLWASSPWMQQHLPAHLPICGALVISPDLPSPVLPSAQLIGLWPFQPPGPGLVITELRSPQTSFLTSQHKKCGGLCSWERHNLDIQWEESELRGGLVTVRGGEGHGSAHVRAGSPIQLRTFIHLNLIDCWECQRQFTG